MNLLFTISLQELQEVFELNFGEVTASRQASEIQAKDPGEIRDKR